MGGEEAEPKAVRHPVLTRRSIVTGKEFLDFGRITFTQHKTTQTAEFLLCKEATLKSKIVGPAVSLPPLPSMRAPIRSSKDVLGVPRWKVDDASCGV